MTHRSEQTHVPILLEREDFLLVSKPAGVAVTGERGTAPDLRELLARQEPRRARQRPLLVHRIDKAASGLLLLATHRQAQRRLCEAFAARRVEKDYLALVWSRPAEEEGLIDQPVDYDSRKGVCKVHRRRGKPAVSRWRVLMPFTDTCLLHVRLLTGRTHQIRVHLAWMSHPIVGDPLYGPLEKGRPRGLFLSTYKPGYRLGRGRREERPMLDRLALHAWRLGFADPTTGEPVHVEAPLPEDLRSALRRLAKYAPVAGADYAQLGLNPPSLAPRLD